MQLRRGPPAGRLADSRNPALRLVQPPTVAVRASHRRFSLRSFDGYSIRAVAGLLLVSVPVSVLLGLVISNWSSQVSIDQAKLRAEATAESAAVRIIDWVGERKAELRHAAQDYVGGLSKPGLNARLLADASGHPSFDDLEIYDRNAKLVGSTQPGLQL